MRIVLHAHFHFMSAFLNDLSTAWIVRACVTSLKLYSLALIHGLFRSLRVICFSLLRRLARLEFSTGQPLLFLRFCARHDYDITLEVARLSRWPAAFASCT